ncbi:hypothetical protein NQ318_010665 [Aromia moschata]|uniref:Uncharacterized protein n=1 Tax=Aromia moschata TaxID=1265417 RepID=A0AAV8XSI8_9CUCU|nr:hypothetical protein NQ318_010665 [Aromia moschata]
MPCPNRCCNPSNMNALTILTALIGILIAIFVYLKNSYNYWKNRGLDYLEPEFGYGNVKKIY